jgi:hypothetical protein
MLHAGAVQLYDDVTISLTPSSALIIYQSRYITHPPAPSEDRAVSDAKFRKFIGNLLRVACQDEYFRSEKPFRVDQLLRSETMQLLIPFVENLGADQHRINAWLKLARPRIYLAKRRSKATRATTQIDKTKAAKDEARAKRMADIQKTRDAIRAATGPRAESEEEDIDIDEPQPKPKTRRKEDIGIEPTKTVEEEDKETRPGSWNK